MTEEVVGRALREPALVSDQATARLDPAGFDPARAADLLCQIETFVVESNRIEGIRRTTGAHVDAHIDFLDGPATIPALVAFVAAIQPDARFRNSPEAPNVRVGNHIAPPSGPQIETDLRRILAMRDPWEQHVAYETLHPFTDGNGRSGRVLWLHRHFHESDLDPWAIQRGFLHSFYYQTLSGVRPASGMSAEGQDAQRLGAEPASPAPPKSGETPK